jgi:hypothetical protein
MQRPVRTRNYDLNKSLQKKRSKDIPSMNANVNFTRMILTPRKLFVNKLAH